MKNNMRKKGCRFCGKTFEKGKQLGGHTASCQLNPKMRNRIGPNRGKKFGLSWRKKMSDSHKGQKQAITGKSYLQFYGREKAKELLELRKKQLIGNTYGIGHEWSEEQKQRQAQRMRGENNPNWVKDRSSFEYGDEWKEDLKEFIRNRDNYRCQYCNRHQNEISYKNGVKRKLSIHHIDYNKKNCDASNLISLCVRCHVQTNYSRDNWKKYFERMRQCSQYVPL